ncbi:protein hinderin-like [Neopsephotus bourkii]|uniref:protein hinderin-like n=1 Tax=Neopsephotus bourkii TaxID=309878 RepID=UPI002AA51645|nr:protein hinderin-like [Neopsephotus bourkii]
MGLEDLAAEDGDLALVFPSGRGSGYAALNERKVQAVLKHTLSVFKLSCYGSKSDLHRVSWYIFDSNCLLKSIFPLTFDVLPLQQQYRECQELLSLYQKYLAEQQEKLSLSLSELSAAKEKEQKVSSKKSLCQQPSLELDGSYLGIGGSQTLHKNGKASKVGSPARVALPQPCRNNYDCGAEIHYNHQESLKEYPVENGLHRKWNNMISPAKQRSPRHVKPPQDIDQKSNEFHSTCPQQVSHACACKQGGCSGSMQESHQVSQVLRKHSAPVHKTCDDSRLSQVSGLNDSVDSRQKETENAKRLYEERRQKLLLQKMELEIEKERLQHLLAEQEAKLLLKQQQLHQSCMDYNRFRGHIPVSEDVLIDEAPGELAVMMNSKSMGLR